MVKIDNENEATARIESALYSAGRPLSVEDLIRASGTESRKTTLNLLTKLILVYLYHTIQQLILMVVHLVTQKMLYQFQADLVKSY